MPQFVYFNHSLNLPILSLYSENLIDISDYVQAAVQKVIKVRNLKQTDKFVLSPEITS